jgi:hypothetical protein
MSLRGLVGRVLKKSLRMMARSFVSTTPSLFMSADLQAIGVGVGVAVGMGVGLGVGVGVAVGAGVGVGVEVLVGVGLGATIENQSDKA